VPTEFGFPPDWPEVSIDIWRRKYRLTAADGTPVDATWGDTARRVARAAASVEAPAERKRWADTFERAIHDFEFLPAGRILAGAGAKRRVTLFNCFVMGRIEDDLTSIFDQVKEAALTMQQGGGIGHDFSTLRPKGAAVASIGADASGPVTFMDVWDSMCRTIQSAGQRRGAMMATLRCDHPDIETFIDAKREKGRLTNFNLSVLVTDAFVAAVKADAPWDLVFAGKVYRTLPARALWERIMRATYEVAEPGVIFIDRVNALNGLSYCEQIQATNPCGEQPLPPYGACLLGSINLARLVSTPFTPEARFDSARLDELTAIATRFLDDVVDLSGYPLKAQRAEAKAKRRLGLGVTGLADALIMLGVRYGSQEAQALTESWLEAIKVAAYRESAALARSKGAFPLCDAKAILAGPTAKSLPDEVRKAIAAHGLRNGLLTSIAPTGTISLLAGNVSSGIEPVFDLAYDRRVLERDGSARTARVEDYAYAAFRRAHGSDAPLPAAIVTANDLAPRAHLTMQASAQRHIDSAISKTINCPEDIAFDAFKDIYLDAYALGLKGITTYRPNAVTGAVLTSAKPQAPSPAISALAVVPLPTVAPPAGLHESGAVM
jgi:ribonucleoside-diphosphate reductase alpha chain